MPMNPADYPENWKDISREVRERAGNRCEFCGVPNGAVGQRDGTGKFWTLDELDQQPAGPPELANMPLKLIRIVLTTAHLCHNSACSDQSHLRALCQKDHLAYDREARESGKQAERYVACRRGLPLEVPS